MTKNKKCVNDMKKDNKCIVHVPKSKYSKCDRTKCRKIQIEYQVKEGKQKT